MKMEGQVQRQGDLGRQDDGIFTGNLVMISHFATGPRFADSEEIAPTWQSARYAGKSNRARFSALLVTTGLHITAIVAMLITWQHAPLPVRAPSPLVVIDLAPLAAPPEPVREVAAGPEKVERERQLEPKPVEVVVPPPLVDVPATQMVARTRQEPVLVVDPGPVVPETTAPRSAAAPTAARLASDARPTWESELLAHLERFRRYPARARAGRQEGVVYVHFKMDRSGSVLSASLVRRSGFAALDQAALDTLKRAQPLPRIPADRPDVIELTMPVEFYLGR